MAKLKCNDIKVLLSSYVDDEVACDKRKIIKEHISKCDSCHTTLFNLLKIKDMIKQEYNNHNIYHKDFSKNIMARVHCNTDCIPSNENKNKFSINSASIKRSIIVAVALFTLVSVLSFDISSKELNSDVGTNNNIAIINNLDIKGADSIKELEVDPLAKFIVDHYSASYSELFQYNNVSDDDIIVEDSQFNYGGVRGVTTVNYE